MTGNYSYDRLPTVHETQDRVNMNSDAYDMQSIIRPLDSEVTLQPFSIANFQGYSSVNGSDADNRAIQKNLNTFDSASSSGSSFEKFKYLGKRIHAKPLPQYLKGSIRRHPATEIEPTRIGRGVWKDQLLVDRSLRAMAALTTLFAIGMITLVCTFAKHFNERANRNTSSVGGDTRACKDVTHTNTVLLLLINVCATMVLGMSNTYQQLVTSLRICDLKHVLQRFGDSRVGVNSPFSINHKQKGKKRAWAAWFLLIMTSMPIHFLANSLIGRSHIQELPVVVRFKELTNVQEYNSLYNGPEYRYDRTIISHRTSFVCWSAFRTGCPHYPKSTDVFYNSEDILESNQKGFVSTWRTMAVHYKSICTPFLNTTTDLTTLEQTLGYDEYRFRQYQEGDCVMGEAVLCTLHDKKQPMCRLSVRMSAAFIITGCLIVKATYMLLVNVLARGKLKTHCLTFGDVIVASASHPELRIQGECMVNAGDSYRRSNSHTCHKHCRNPDQSKTGDEIGHCQICIKWNSTNKFSNEPQPTIATKIKKSLISNLGNMALTQLCLLMFCSFALLSVSLREVIQLNMSFQSLSKSCAASSPNDSFYEELGCNLSATERFEKMSGGWGGFNKSRTLAFMKPDRLGNEFISFGISNGAQFIYSLLYLMLIYNITLISQEQDWGKLEYERKRIRCTIVASESFLQDYLLQLPKKILFPLMAYSILTHWMLGEALQSQEAIWLEISDGRHVEHSRYMITSAAYSIWAATFLVLLMTGMCWWAFTYKREGFIPQMFGSIRVLCAATTQLNDFPSNGIQWGDIDEGQQFRHAGLSAEGVMKIVPNELYAGTSEKSKDAMELAS